MSPEAIHSHYFTTASDVFSFGVSMWECFTYGQTPWNEMTNEEVTFLGIFEKQKSHFFLKIINAIDTPNPPRLPRPPYATSELYQIMIHCWKCEPSERPTFSQLEKTFEDV
jgi:serine/threonine protein kinase